MRRLKVIEGEYDLLKVVCRLHFVRSNPGLHHSHDKEAA